mmetsp:Transcript_35133/g.78697  ORF Transcript_35133/g.78697 Transcript_35133/m.78697 type:complete len:286 (-) Transcript_35133:823-1680(-)
MIEQRLRSLHGRLALMLRNKLLRDKTSIVQPAIMMVGSHRVPCSTHLHCLQDTAIPQLFRHTRPIVDVWLILRVGLDAAHEVGICLVDRLHQFRELFLEFGRQSHWFLLLALAFTEFFVVVLEPCLHKRICGALHDLDTVYAQLVFVLVQELVHAILHWPGKMVDDEPVLLLLDDVEPSIPLMLLLELIHETQIRASNNQALLIQHRKNSRWLLLDQVYSILIVGKIQRIPRNAFLLVQRFLLLEDKGVEKLLEPLICEIDAQLLEGIELETLESKNIQHTDKQF